MLFNIGIDGLCATGKTTIGEKLAVILGYTFIDSGIFYRYFALIYFYLTNEQIQTRLINQKSDIIKNFQTHFKQFYIVNKLDRVKYLQNGRRASQLAKNDEVRKVINEIIKSVTKSKGFIIVGRDVTTNIIPDADIKIVLTSNLMMRIVRRQFQTGIYTSYIRTDILQRDEKSYKFIEDAVKVSSMIDTTCLTIDQVIKRILFLVYFKRFKIFCIKYQVVIIIIFIYLLIKIIN
jgi:CMP/dCMP kinase